MLYDSHAHLNFSSFEKEYKEIVADCLKNKIGVLNIGSQFDTSKRAIEIANEFPNQNIFASIGIHPIHLSQTEFDEEEIKFKSREENFNSEKYQSLINQDKNKKIIAIGEIGLDYFHIPEDSDINEVKEKQKQGLISQIKFAQKNNLPIILHARGSQPTRNDSQAKHSDSGGENPQDAYLDLLEIINKDAPRRVSTGTEHTKGVLHCFGSNLEIAKKFIDLGFYIGFTGIITFKNKSVSELQNVVKEIPLEKILIETDAPYLTPEPHRGKKNQPQYVKHVAEKVAELKNLSFEKVVQQTTQNFKNLFLGDNDL